MENDQVLYGEDCFFVGEDLPLKARVQPGIIDWMIHLTLKAKECTAHDMTAKALTAAFKKFKITLNPKKFANDVNKLNLGQFQERYFFDKRILPHFWYCFLKGTNEDVGFFEAYGTFNTNTFELRVFEAAYRESFLEHTALQHALLSMTTVDQFVAQHKNILKVLVSGRSVPIKQYKENIAPFFLSVRAFTVKHSKILKYLNPDQELAYFEELLFCLPPASLRMLNLEF